MMIPKTGDNDMYDQVVWFIMEKNDDPEIVAELLKDGAPKSLARLYALAQEVMEAPDENNLHRRIYSEAMANRLEG